MNNDRQLCQTNPLIVIPSSSTTTTTLPNNNLMLEIERLSPLPLLLTQSNNSSPISRIDISPTSATNSINLSTQKPTNNILMTFNFDYVYAASFLPPILGLVGVFIIGILFDSRDLFNYKWNCGVNFFFCF